MQAVRDASFLKLLLCLIGLKLFTRSSEIEEKVIPVGKAENTSSRIIPVKTNTLAPISCFKICQFSLFVACSCSFTTRH